MSDIAIGSKIPTTFLPSDWRAKGAANFECSESTVERVVWGYARPTKRNREIFDFMLKMAEDGKADHDKKEEERLLRLQSLNHD